MRPELVTARQCITLGCYTGLRRGLRVLPKRAYVDDVPRPSIRGQVGEGLWTLTVHADEVRIRGLAGVRLEHDVS